MVMAKARAVPVTINEEYTPVAMPIFSRETQPLISLDKLGNDKPTPTP